MSAGSTVMMRFLIALGLVLIVLGVLWPYLSRLGLGRLPGDIMIERPGGTFYFPIVTCLILSIAFSALMWWFGR
jgi:hypothetical protein